jgi:uncharacterized protein
MKQERCVNRPKPISRRTFIGLGASALATSLAATYSAWVEPEWLDLCTQRVLLGTLPQRVRVLHLSDFHWSAEVSLDFIEAAIAMGLSAKPDLICLTGDFITVGESRPLAEYQRILSMLSAYAPSYAVLGNHDGGSWSHLRDGYESVPPMIELLRGAGITVLNNGWQACSIGKSHIAIVGTGDLWAGSFEPDQAFGGLDPELYSSTLLLAHNPDTKDFVARKPWNLMLSGHTHGGQVVLPLIGPPFVPVQDKGYVAGLKAWNSRWVYITRGVGNLLGLRFNCRPEVTILDLV